ncbi:MAG: hypothetical protein QF535_24365, partial [Anaerolineales bacterium]|nr:hypothetical protein [Anaerolineales bacterium]
RIEGDVAFNSINEFNNYGTLDSGGYSNTTLRNDNTEITTIAGKLENYADGTGQTAEFRYLNRMLRIGTNIYVTDDNRIRKVDSTTGAVSTLQTSGDSYNYIDWWTSDGTDIYFSSYFYSSTGNEYKLFKMSPAGVVSELDMVSDNGSFKFSNSLYGLTSDGTDLFAGMYSSNSGSGSSIKIHRIALQTGSGGTHMVTPYTTGGQSLSYLNGMEKVGDSLFALYSNKIYEIKLSGTSATVSTVPMSTTDNSTSNYYDRMTSSGDALYLSGSGSGSSSMIRPVFSVALSSDNGSTTGVVTQINPTVTAASFYNTGAQVPLQYFSDFTTDGSAVYVADSQNKLIRKINLSTSNITTIAGKLENYADGTGENAEFRYLNRMLRVGTDLYVSDENRIRKVDSATGAVSTLQTSGDSYNYIDWWT